MENLDSLLTVFAVAYHADRDKHWLERFFQMFSFLKGEAISQYVNPIRMNYWKIEVVYILRALRHIGVTDFREVWKKAISKNSLIMDSVDFFLPGQRHQKCG